MKSKTLSRIAFVCFFAGGAIGTGGTYYQVTRPSSYPNIERYNEINEELNIPKFTLIRLGNLESKTTELASRANKLKDERNKITQNNDFVETQKNYKSEQKRGFKTTTYFVMGGLGSTLFSFIPLSLSGKREKEEKIKRELTNSFPNYT